MQPPCKLSQFQQSFAYIHLRISKSIVKSYFAEEIIVSSKTLAMIIIVIFAVLVPSVFAKEFVVGDEMGWTTNYDYQNWTKGKEFHVGDSLIFQYQPGTHSVLRVNLTEFHRCIVPADDKKALTSGSDVFSLNSPGHKYYICTVGNDCSSFYQKLNITVLPAVESPQCSPSPNNTNSNTRSVAPCYSGWLVAMVGLLGTAMV